MSQPSHKITKGEQARLRQLAGRAWEAELNAELQVLYDAFAQWADKALSAFELSDLIHAFHNGSARDLYGRYASLDARLTVSRAVALGILGEQDLGPDLMKKLAGEIDVFR
jgi:hypothetical protein